MRLTEKQQLTLNFIAKYWGNHGYSPSIAEIRDGLGLAVNSNNTVIFRLDSLEKFGLITRNRKTARSIKLTELGKSSVIKLSETKIIANATRIGHGTEVTLINYNNYREE